MIFHSRKIMAIMVLMAMVSVPCLTEAEQSKREKEGSSSLTRLIAPSRTDWVQSRLQDGNSVVLTHSYLFQVMKGASQENQKRIEEAVLIPALEKLLRALVRASDNTDLRRLFGVPLAILTDEPNVELPPEAIGQAKELFAERMFAPRGHYTDSELLKRFFVAMQFLSKATVDVAIRPDSYPFPRYTLYHFKTGVKAAELLADPANRKLLDQWRAIHAFYTYINGPADGPTLLDMVDLVAKQSLTKEAVQAWAESKGLPRINAERGLGVQPFGERSSMHQEAIDELKRACMKDDTPRETISDLLRFKNLLSGSEQAGKKVEGLADRVGKAPQDTYYGLVLTALALGARDWKENAVAANLFASGLTALAEQTALMTKTSILVRKSPEPERPIPKRAKLILPKDSADYLRGLGKATASLTAACKDVQKTLDLQPEPKVKLLEVKELFDRLESLVRKGLVEIPAKDLWKKYGEQLGTLVRKPAVTVDVFQVRERSGKVFFYQWAIAPFEATFPVGGAQKAERGLEMVFFEGWADEIIPDHDGPLNNLLWEGRVVEGNLEKLPSILSIPADSLKD